MFYINGCYVREEDAKISVMDLGLVRGYGVFDYLRTYSGRPFHLWDHLERLAFSAKEIGISLPCPLKKIEEIVETLLEENDYPESSIKIIVTGGKSEDQFSFEEQASLIVLVYPLKPFSEECYVKGITATTTMHKRSFPIAKTINYIPAIIAMQKGKEKNAKEALYLNSKKEILEATTSNFFGIKDNVLFTADSKEVLIGITREVILKIAKEHFSIKMKAIPLKEVSSLDEAFVSSSNKEVMPVVAIDGMSIGSGHVGEKTKFLMKLFAEYAQQGDYKPLKIARYSKKKDPCEEMLCLHGDF